MTLVNRNEIVDYETYEDTREAFRKSVLEIKKPRRIHIGDHLTFLFENRITIRYQVQEMMRTERIVKESSVQHELDTYNDLLGGSGELGCTLLIEIDDEAQRQVLLRAWLDLPGHLYIKLKDGERVPAKYDARQIGEDRLSSVQYLKFDTKGRLPVAIGSDLPALRIETMLSSSQQEALTEDLR